MTTLIRTTVDKVAVDSAVYDLMQQNALFPEYTTTQRDALVGMRKNTMIYNTTTNKYNFYTGAAWEAVTSA